MLQIFVLLKISIFAIPMEVKRQFPNNNAKTGKDGTTFISFQILS